MENQETTTARGLRHAARQSRRRAAAVSAPIPNVVPTTSPIPLGLQVAESPLTELTSPSPGPAPSPLPTHIPENVITAERALLRHFSGCTS